MRGLVLAMPLGCAVPAAAASEKVVKEMFGFDEKKRTCQRYDK
jgi:hypothetical protein